MQQMSCELRFRFQRSRLFAIPVDVVEQKILSLVSCSSVISCLLVCHRLRALASRVLMDRKNKLLLLLAEGKTTAKMSFQQSILLSVFEEGAPIPLLQWFETYLRYPVFPPHAPTTHASKPIKCSEKRQSMLKKCASLAAKGTTLSSASWVANVNFVVLVVFSFLPPDSFSSFSPHPFWYIQAVICIFCDICKKLALFIGKVCWFVPQPLAVATSRC